METFSESEGMAPFILILTQDGCGCLVLRPFHSELWENRIPKKFWTPRWKSLAFSQSNPASLAFWPTA